MVFKMKSTFALVLSALCFVFAASGAFATTFQCEITKFHANNTWVAPNLVFKYNPNTGNATVVDDITKTVWVSPVPAKVSGDINSKIVFKWELKDVPQNHRRPTVPNYQNASNVKQISYKASISMKTGKIVIKVNFGYFTSYVSKVEGSGLCKIKR